MVFWRQSNLSGGLSKSGVSRQVRVPGLQDPSSILEILCFINTQQHRAEKEVTHKLTQVCEKNASVSRMIMASPSTSRSYFPWEFRNLLDFPTSTTTSVSRWRHWLPLLSFFVWVVEKSIHTKWAMKTLLPTRTQETIPDRGPPYSLAVTASDMMVVDSLVFQTWNSLLWQCSSNGEFVVFHHGSQNPCGMTPIPTGYSNWNSCKEDVDECWWWVTVLSNGIAIVATMAIPRQCCLQRVF